MFGPICLFQDPQKIPKAHVFASLATTSRSVDRSHLITLGDTGRICGTSVVLGSTVVERDRVRKTRFVPRCRKRGVRTGNDSKSDGNDSKSKNMTTVKVEMALIRMHF